jgi:hypothetical protein
MTTIGGLPAHILLVHAVVVLIPLSAVLLVVIAISSRARRRLDILTVILAVVALVSVPLTTEAGDWLEHRLPRTALLRTHTHLGDSMLPWAVALALVTILVVVTQRRRDRRIDDFSQTGDIEAGNPGRRDRRGRVTSTVLALIAVLVAAGSVVTVYRIGDSGARAAWTGNFSSQPLPPPVGQLPQGG